MKKLLLLVIGLVLVGAGCGASNIESDWVLGFTEAGENWHLVPAYRDRDELKDMQKDLSFDSLDAVIQTTESFIFTGDAPEDLSEYGEAVTEDYIKITMERMDSRRNIPADAESLGKGFYKVSETEYYLELPDEKYQFLVELEGRDASEAEQLILSAKRAKPPAEDATE